MAGGVVAREPVPRAVVPPVLAVVKVKLCALVLKGVDASLSVDQKLERREKKRDFGSMRLLRMACSKLPGRNLKISQPSSELF